MINNGYFEGKNQTCSANAVPPAITDEEEFRTPADSMADLWSFAALMTRSSPLIIV